MIKKLFKKINNLIFKNSCKFKHLQDKKTVNFNKQLAGKFLGKRMHVVNGVSLSIDDKKEFNKEVFENNIKQIADKYLNEPEKLFEYVNSQGTKVYTIKNADKLLSLIGEQEGFVLPQSGIKAIFLNLLINRKISNQTHEVFVLRNYDTIKCSLLYQFYNWYCYKHNIDGFQTNTQRKFRNVFKICSSNDELEQLSFEDVMLLKTAVRRDIDAIEFVQKYVSETVKSKEKLEKIKTGKLVKI